MEFGYDDYIAVSFLKVTEKNKILTGEKYEVETVNGDKTGIFTEEGQYGQHRIGYFARNPELVELLIPDCVKEALNDVTSWDDLAIYENSEVLHVRDNYTRYVLVSFNVPVVLKQVETVPGYQARDVVFMGNGYYRFDFNNSGTLTYKQKSFYLRSEIYLTDEEIKPINTLEDLASYKPMSYYDLDHACLNTDDSGRIIINDGNSCTGFEDYGNSMGYEVVPFFVSKKGTVEFEINYLVNGVTKYNASENKNLKYEIAVDNIGNVSSSNNVIVTYIPEGIEIKENSISDGGIYNKKDNTITWNVELIGIGEELTFTYDALAPNDVNGKELIGKSSISSDQVLRAVYSNNTIVTLDKIIEVITNPETGTKVYLANTNIGISINILIMFAIALLFVLIVSLRRLKHIKRHI